MAKKRTSSSPYCSPTTGEYCTAQQYIAELVCLRAFKRFDIGPSYKFWNKEQQDRYRGTIMAVSLLCREYGAPALLDYLNGPGWNIFYVGFYKKIPDYVREGVAKSRKKLDSIVPVIKEAEPEQIYVVVAEDIVTKGVKSKGLFGRLKNIEAKSG
jgi:hypothetical protein